MQTARQLLKTLRLDRGLSRQAFAFKMQKAGMDHWTDNVVDNLESGPTAFTEDRLRDLIQAGFVTIGDEWHRSFQIALMPNIAMMTTIPIDIKPTLDGVQLSFMSNNAWVVINVSSTKPNLTP